LRGKERSIWRNSSTEGNEEEKQRDASVSGFSFEIDDEEGRREASILTVDSSDALQARLGPEEELRAGRDVVEGSRASGPRELSGEGRRGLDGGDGGNGRLDGGLGERSSGDGGRETGRLGSGGRRRRLSSGSDDGPGSSSVGVLLTKRGSWRISKEARREG